MEDKKFVFNSGSISMEEVEIKGEKKDFLKGFISTDDLDLVDDVVTQKCMDSMVSQLKDRTIKLDFEHEAFRGDTDIDMETNKTKIPLGKRSDWQRKSNGIEVTWELNPTWKQINSKGDIVTKYKDIIYNLKNGFYDAFSIAYIPTKTQKRESKDKDVRLLDDVTLLNVALTGNAVNPNATVSQVFAKSLEYMKSKKEDEDEEEEEEKKKESKGGPGSGPRQGHGTGPNWNEFQEIHEKLRKEQQQTYMEMRRRGISHEDTMNMILKKKKGFYDAFSIAHKPKKKDSQYDKIKLNSEEKKKESKGGPGSGPRQGQGRGRSIKVTSTERQLLEHIENLPERQRKQVLEGNMSNLQEVAHDIGLNPRKIDTAKIYDHLQDNKEKLIQGKDYSQYDKIKLNSEAKMSEEEKTAQELEDTEKKPSKQTSEAEAKSVEKKEEKPDEKESEKEDGEKEEMKAQIKALTKELADVKAMLKKPLTKGKSEQRAPSEQKSVQSKGPLDFIS